MITTLLLAAAAQTVVLPGVLDLPLAGRSRVTPCPAYIAQGMAADGSKTFLACVSGVVRPMEANQRQQDTYTTAIARTGWTFKEGAANVLAYTRGCDELAFLGAPTSMEDMNRPAPRGVVFVFRVERKACPTR